MRKCKCRVCVVGDWINSKYGLKTWEDWANEGLTKEGYTYDNPGILTSFFYNLHFFKPWLILKYYNRTIK